MLKNKQEEQSKHGDPSLRFSEFQISNISIEKIDSIFISRLLARSSSVYPNATTQSQLDDAISKERKLILESIFSHLSTLGKMKIPEQIMQYSQRGGECEQASLVSFRNFYIGRSDVRIASKITKLMSERGIEFGLALANKIRANIDQISSTPILEQRGMKNRTIINLKNELAKVEGAISDLKMLDAGGP